MLKTTEERNAKHHGSLILSQDMMSKWILGGGIGVWKEDSSQRASTCQGLAVGKGILH